MCATYTHTHTPDNNVHACMRVYLSILNYGRRRGRRRVCLLRLSQFRGPLATTEATHNKITAHHHTTPLIRRRGCRRSRTKYRYIFGTPWSCWRKQNIPNDNIRDARRTQQNKKNANERGTQALTLIELRVLGKCLCGMQKETHIPLAHTRTRAHVQRVQDTFRARTWPVHHRTIT